MGSHADNSILYSGAKSNDILIGSKPHNKGLVIQIKEEQSKSNDQKAKHIIGDIKILQSGTGTHCDIIKKFKSKNQNNYFPAENLSKKIIHEKSIRSVYVLYTGSLEIYQNEINYADEIPETSPEGARKKVYINAYERNPSLRKQCIDNYGYICAVCELSMKKIYGDIGKNYIHLHHLTPLSSIKVSHIVEPHRDLRPVCPNCHSMLHRKNPPYSIEELKSIIRGEDI